MKKSVIGLNVKYLKLIPFLGILPVLVWFLPYLSVKEIELSVTGFSVLIRAFQLLETGGLDGSVCAVIGIFGITAILVLIGSIVTFCRPSKSSVKGTLMLYVLYTLSLILVLFTAKKAIDSSGLLEVKFLIKFLGSGYWISLVLGFVGMVISMKAAKINPGYIVLCIMSVIWLFPIAWIVMNSFRAEGGSYINYFFPKEITFHNYIKLLTDDSQFYYTRWFMNTLAVAASSCALTTFIVLSTSFVLSRIRFTGRKTFMKLLLILGMFPGFMSMIAVYYILKGMGLTQSLIALVIVYSSGASLGYYVSKGFFDTIPKALDEAACIDGATKWQVFTRITIPLSKPIIIYTILTSFMGPWADYIFSSIILGDNYKNYTIALGLFTMLNKNNIETWYTRFAAGSVLVSIPIAVLFICLQKYYVEGLSGSVKG